MRACATVARQLRSFNQISLSRTSVCAFKSIQSINHVPSRAFAKMPPQPKAKAPLLSATLRKFYFLVHPDLFAAHPERRAVNEASLQQFLGFITALKSTNSDEPWPPVQHRNLTFFIRKRDADQKVIDGAFDLLQITLSTNGGNCKSSVETQLSSMFKRLKLAPKFRFDDDYFQLKPPQLRKEEEAEYDEDAQYQ